MTFWNWHIKLFLNIIKNTWNSSLMCTSHLTFIMKLRCHFTFLSQTSSLWKKKCGNEIFIFYWFLAVQVQSSEKAWLKAGPQQTLECRSPGLTRGCFGKSADQEWLSSGFHCFSFIIHLIRENFKWAKGAHSSIFATHRICWTTIKKEKNPEKMWKKHSKEYITIAF